MSRILIVTPYFHPEKTGISVTATDCASFCRQMGHEVVVVTAFPFFPQMKIADQYAGRWFCREDLDGIRIERVWLYVPREDSTLKRVLHAFSFALSASFRAVFLSYDLMICTVPFLPTAFLVGILANLRRKPFWLYIKDLEIDAAANLSMLRGRLVTNVARLFEQWTYWLADKILGITRGYLERLKELGVDGRKLQLVPDSVDARGEFGQGRQQAERENYFVQEYGLSDRIIFLHAGALTAKHDIDTILEAAQRLRGDDRVFLAVFGEGVAEQHARSRITHKQLKNIEVFPLCARDKFAWMVASADVGVLAMRRGAASASFPSKVLSYLAAGKPVLAAVEADSEVGALLGDKGMGLVVGPEDMTAFVDGVKRLADNKPMRARMGETGLRFAMEQLDNESVKRKYYRSLLSLG